MANNTYNSGGWEIAGNEWLHDLLINNNVMVVRDKCQSKASVTL